MAPCEKKLRDEVLNFDKKEVWFGDNDETTTISYSDSDEDNVITFRKDIDGSWSVAVEAYIELKPSELLVIKDMCDWLKGDTEDEKCETL